MTPPPLLIRNLTEEHRGFTAAFKSLYSLAETGERPEFLAALLALCDEFLTLYHQTKEEKLLYPRLRCDPCHRAGGPECVLHFDFFMADRPLERSLRLLREGGVEAEIPPLSDEAADDQKSGSPLSIPEEDHQAGRVLLRSLARRPEPRNREELDLHLRLFREFFRTQSEHHRREEGCFFRLCQALIDERGWEELAAQEEKWNPPLSRAGMVQAIAALESSGWSSR